MLVVTTTVEELLEVTSIDDLERQWNVKSGFLVIYLWFQAATHILTVNCAKITR